MENQENMRKMLEEQVALGEHVVNTAQFLRFALNISTQNLMVIRQQLERIRDLNLQMETEQINDDDSDSPVQ